MVILMDVDGVVCDWVGGVLRVVADVTGQDIPRTAVNGWNFIDSLPITDEERLMVFNDISAPGFCSDLRPLPGAVEGIMALRDKTQCQLVWVTSPWPNCPTWAHERADWLFKYFLATEDDEIIHTEAKWRVTGDVMVDDFHLNVQRWQANHPQGTGILWRSTYNEQHTSPIVAASWRDVLELCSPMQEEG